MTQEIEIEFKNIVTNEEFLHLRSIYSISDKDFQKQINYYFDTEAFQLKSHGSALRIREKKGNYTLTLKQPSEVGLLETHQKISKDEALIAFNSGKLPKGTVATQLYSSYRIDISICQCLGSLTTIRAEKQYAGGTLVFDHSYYLGEEDFEIEYEVTDENKGKELFYQLFSQNNIPIRPTDNKIRRFFNRKYKMIN